MPSTSIYSTKKELIKNIEVRYVELFNAVNIAIYNNKQLNTKENNYYKITKNTLAEAKKNDYTFNIKKSDIKILDYVIKNKREMNGERLEIPDKLIKLLQIESTKASKSFIKKLNLKGV